MVRRRCTDRMQSNKQKLVPNKHMSLMSNLWHENHAAHAVENLKQLSESQDGGQCTFSFSRGEECSQTE